MRNRALLALGLVAFVALLVAPIGCDYPIFKGAARAVLAGESRLFDAGAPGFFYAPWSLALYAPLSFLPDRVSSALLNLASVLALIWAVYALVGSAPWYLVLIAVANIWTANLIGAAQFDAFTTAAAAMVFVGVQRRSPWLVGAALAIAAMKPTNVWLAVVLALLGAVEARWSWRDWYTAGIIPALCLLASIVISGWYWPVRYLDFIASTPPSAGYNLASSAQSALGLGLHLVALLAVFPALWFGVSWYGLRSGPVIALGLVVNLLISPYATIYHYVGAVPALVLMGKRDALLLVGLYAASVAWVIIRPMIPIYPAALALAIAGIVWDARRAFLMVAKPKLDGLC